MRYTLYPWEFVYANRPGGSVLHWIFDKRISGSRAEERGYKRILAINQRVKSVIGIGKKIEPDSMAIRSEKEASTAFRQSFRIALYLLFATKVSMGGGVHEKVYSRVNL